MIRFSFSSLYMAILFSNLLILLLYLVFRRRKLLASIGLPSLTAVLCIAILRMVFPIELLFLSRNIYLPEVLSCCISFLLHPCFFGGRFSIWSFLKVIWGTGIVISLFLYVKRERAFAKYLRISVRELPDSSDAIRILREIQQEIPQTQRIQLRTLSGLPSPSIYGFFRPCILLPEELSLDQEQLGFILRHEVTHFVHHDLYKKLGMQLLCILYWWNPLCHNLLRQVDAVLEMQVDQKIALQPEQKLNYLNCLLKIARQPDRSLCTASMISFCDSPYSPLRQRVDMLIHEEETGYSKRQKHCLLLALILLFLLSYVYIFEASSISNEEAAGSVEPTAENSYFIKREDGQYDFYLNGKYTGIADSLEYYPDDIPIYER